MACALTTYDNPFNPLEQFDSWYMFDVENGYNTCALLDRMCFTASSFSEKENDSAIEKAIDDIIKNDMTGFYRKVIDNEEEKEKESIV